MWMVSQQHKSAGMIPLTARYITHSALFLIDHEAGVLPLEQAPSSAYSEAAVVRGMKLPGTWATICCGCSLLAGVLRTGPLWSTAHLKQVRGMAADWRVGRGSRDQAGCI